MGKRKLDRQVNFHSRHNIDSSYTLHIKSQNIKKQLKIRPKSIVKESASHIKTTRFVCHDFDRISTNTAVDFVQEMFTIRQQPKRGKVCGALEHPARSYL
jgi:hypothetical protein